MSVLPFKGALGHNGGPEMEPDEEATGEEETREEFLRLMGLSVDDILREGQKALFADLVGKVRSGHANYQEKAILRNILKDNGLTLGIPPEQPASTAMPADLPTFTDPEY